MRSNGLIRSGVVFIALALALILYEPAMAIDRNCGTESADLIAELTSPLLAQADQLGYTSPADASKFVTEQLQAQLVDLKTLARADDDGAVSLYFINRGQLDTATWIGNSAKAAGLPVSRWLGRRLLCVSQDYQYALSHKARFALFEGVVPDYVRRYAGTGSRTPDRAWLISTTRKQIDAARRHRNHEE